MLNLDKIDCYILDLKILHASFTKYGRYLGRKDAEEIQFLVSI